MSTFLVERCEDRDTDDYKELLSAAYVVTILGNHDDPELVLSIENRDGAEILLTH